MTIVDTAGKVPYSDLDDTRRWIESFRVNNTVKPNVVLRWATDCNYVLNQKVHLPAYDSSKGKQATKALLNITMPGQRVPGLLNWQVNEATDSPVQTASFELVNALLLSKTRTTIASGSLAAQMHSLTITKTYCGNSLGVVRPESGDVDINTVADSTGILYQEDRVRYREFQEEQFVVTSATGFPDPGIPTDDDGNDVALTYPTYMSATGVGSYYVLIDNEVVRVTKLSGSTFTIPPGGRGVNGVLETHGAGSVVTLLGYGPFDHGKWTGMGWLDPDDFRPQKCPLRPGACLVSYEGYGEFPSPLSHNGGPNYEFTGFWFVKGLEASIGEDMQPRVRVDLVSAGEVFNKQKITLDLIQRIKNKFGEWHIGEEDATIWGLADHTRNIPGDWVDYHHWDPTLSTSYPLKIKTELAQHKEFMEHMRSTEFGKTCDLCQAERKAWIQNHEDPEVVSARVDAMSPGPAKTAALQYFNDLQFQYTKQIGRHVYKSSIRVLDPVKTHIRLMAAMAAGAWDHPAFGTEAAQRFSRLPNTLFDNIRKIDETGLIFNGQMDYRLDSSAPAVDWTDPDYQDRDAVMKQKQLTCPFEATYDKAPFYQPMQDMADVNGNTFWVNRQGMPVMLPRDLPLRPYGGIGQARTGEWFMTHGASIQAYSHSINIDAVITQVWVTATTPWETQNGPITFTLAASGTGYGGGTGQRMVYSQLAGNKEGLALTGGVQQVETASMDNQILGLSWNTKPSKVGLQEIVVGTGEIVVVGIPTIPDVATPLVKGSQAPKRIEQLQKLLNFFLSRRYVPFIAFNSQTYFQIPEDGKFGNLTAATLNEVQQYLIDNLPSGFRPASPYGLTGITNDMSNDRYGRSTELWCMTWFNLDDVKTNHYVNFDIFWYVYNGLSWDEYVGALLGIKVPVKKVGIKRKPKGPMYISDQSYLIMDTKMEGTVRDWMRNHAESAVNYGNRIVDDSIAKSIVRSIQTNWADPRIQPGDIIWAEVPGHLTKTSAFGNNAPPFDNGIYVTSLSRQLDFLSGTYSATYSGYKYRSSIAAPTPSSGSASWERAVVSTKTNFYRDVVHAGDTGGGGGGDGDLFFTF